MDPLRPFTSSAKSVTEHHAVIDEYTANGYRYVDSIVTETDSRGGVKKMDLVFEKDAE